MICRRFLRKPNVTEACESFTVLGQHCEKEELPTYAGLCWIAAAQCEGSLANIPGETACLRRSAQQFLASEIKSVSLGCPTPSNENLSAALSCYAHATTRYPENSQILAVNIHLEIVEALKKLKYTDKVEMYLKNAVKLSDNSLEMHLYCLENLGGFYISCGDYVSALDIFTELANLIESTPSNAARRDILLMCEINRVLMLLILRPVPQSLSVDLTRILEKYTWNQKIDKSLSQLGMSDAFFLLLQSLVLTCQANDVTCTAHLENELWQFLNAQQKDLLRVLLQIYK